MRIFKKAAASTVAVGLLAFGAVAGSSGSAHASTGTSVTACNAQFGGASLGLFPNCTAGDSTIDNPTSLTVTISSSKLTALLAVVGGINTTWTLSCVVNGSTVSEPGSYDITSASDPTSTTIDLQSAVGSPEPNSCTISSLHVTSLLALGIGAVGLNLFTLGVSATATTAVPGAIYQNEGKTSGGASAVLCADDTGNGNSGSRIQSFQCLSDLADYFVQTSSGQLVHNGDCMSVSGSGVFLSACTGASSQQWLQSTVGGQLKNKGSNSCLTAVSAKDGTALQVRSCTGKANQNWRIPDKSAAV